MLCFINIDKIEEFKKIILNKLNEYQGYTKFKNYIKNYLFKINPKIYNFSELIDYFNKHNNNKFIDKIHTTNIISVNVLILNCHIIYLKKIRKI